MLHVYQDRFAWQTLSAPLMRQAVPYLLHCNLHQHCIRHKQIAWMSYKCCVAYPQMLCNSEILWCSAIVKLKTLLIFLMQHEAGLAAVYTLLATVLGQYINCVDAGHLFISNHAQQLHRQSCRTSNFSQWTRSACVDNLQFPTLHHSKYSVFQQL